MSKSEVQEIICGKCRLPIQSGEVEIRHFGFFTAHSEHRCIELLEQQVESLRAELARANEDLEQHSENWRVKAGHLEDERDGLRAERDAALRSADLWEQTAKLGRNLMPCGHQEMWAYSHDGGKNGFCLLCRNAERDALLADKERLDWLSNSTFSLSRTIFAGDPEKTAQKFRESIDAARKPVSQEPK